MTIDIFSAGPAGGRLNQSHGGFSLEVPVNATGTWQAQVRREMIAQVPAQVWCERPDVSLRVGGATTIEVRAGGRSWSLPAEECDHRPELPTAAGEWYPGAILSGAWKSVLPAMGSDYGRPALCSLEIAASAHGVQLTATDGYRLAQVHRTAVTELPAGTWTLPAEAALWLAKRKDAWSWRRSLTGTEACGTGWRLWAETVPGYPDYRPITEAAAAQHCTSTASVQAALLADAVRSVRVGKPFRTCRLAWSRGHLALTGSGQPGKGHSGKPAAEASLTVETAGDEASLTVDTDRLLPMLASLGRQQITLRFQAATRPLGIVADDYIGVLMVCRP